MTSYVPPKKGSAFVFYVALVARATRPLFQANPTLAAGDVKVSIDGGALNNLATLPDVDPNSGVPVKVSLDSDEMNGDNIQVVFIDATGAEWDDLFISIQTTAQQIDDLPAGKTGYALSTAGVDAIIDEVTEGTMTLREAVNIMLAALAGKSSGGGTNTLVFNDNADSKPRITATVDTVGNRTAMTVDGA